MSYLLDTHVGLWWLTDADLSDETLGVLADPDQHVVVSVASLWEISIKSALGKLKAKAPIVDAIVADFDLLAINGEHAWEAGQLPPHHRDPFDRMLIAQALLEGLTIITRDRRFEPYGVPLLAA